MDCTELTSVTIPDSVTGIGCDAFYCCGLAEINYNGTVADWGKIYKNSMFGNGYYSNMVINCTDGIISIVYGEETTTFFSAK